MLQETGEKRLTAREVLEQGDRAKAAAVHMGLRRVAVKADGVFLALSFFMRNEQQKQRKHLCLLAPSRIATLTDEQLQEQLGKFVQRKATR